MFSTAVSSITETDLKPKTNFMKDDELPENIFRLGQDPKSEKTYEQTESPAHKKFDPDKWSRKNAKIKRGAWLAPGSVEVFNITSGIKEKREENREITDIPLMKEKPKSVWDTLGLMKTIRQSFFNNFFSPIFGSSETICNLVSCKL